MATASLFLLHRIKPEETSVFKKGAQDLIQKRVNEVREREEKEKSAPMPQNNPTSSSIFGHQFSARYSSRDVSDIQNDRDRHTVASASHIGSGGQNVTAEPEGGVKCWYNGSGGSNGNGRFAWSAYKCSDSTSYVERPGRDRDSGSGNGNFGSGSSFDVGNRYGDAVDRNLAFRN